MIKMVLIDGTLGGGGHALIIQKLNSGGIYLYLIKISTL